MTLTADGLDSSDHAYELAVPILFAAQIETFEFKYHSVYGTVFELMVFCRDKFSKREVGNQHLILSQSVVTSATSTPTESRV